MINIKRNNKVFFTIEDFGEGSKLSYQLMDHHYIILKFTTASPIYFEIGDSVEIPDFGYFELTSAYFPKHNDSDGYDYEMQMDAYYMAWKNKLCKYRPQYGANETSFKLTTSVGVHMNVILGNLKALGLTYNGKDFSVDYTTYNNNAFDVQKRFLIEYGSISIIDALNSICSEDALNCEWWIDGSIIYLGYCETEGQTTFEQDVNVLSMSYSESKSTYITRLYAFGSDRNIPKGYFTGADADVTTDGVATDYLMLPNKEVDKEGFYSKDGYLENVNVVKNEKQAIEGVVMFEDEYPKVESVVSNIKTYDSTVDNDDGTKTTQTFWQVTATDAFATSFETSWKKKNLTLGIKFTSGALMGMEFDVSFKVIDKVNYFEIVANETYGRTLPDGVMCPKVGDMFFIYNWDATKITDTTLIQTAQSSLFERAKQYYQKTMISNSNFTCTMDGDKFYNDGTYDYHPLGEQVKLINDMFSQVDAEGKHYRNSRIIGMDIPLDIPYDHPQYTVGEKAATSRLGKLEDKVDSITVNGIQIGGGGGVGGGAGVYVIGVNDTTPETDSNVYSARRVRNDFLSKVKEDTAQKAITFKEGLKVGDVGKGIDGNGDAVLGDVVVDRVHDVNSTPADRVVVGAQGFDLYLGEDGKSHLYIDFLVARVKAFFAQLEIRRVSYSGGTTIFSNAGSTIAKVMELKNGKDTVAYKCYAVADDGTTKTKNWWHVGMMALCQTFNVKSGTSNDVSNRYYWRLVVDTGQEVLEDGKLYDYVILSNVRDFEGGDAMLPSRGVRVLADERGRVLRWGGVAVAAAYDGELVSMAELFEQQEGSGTDDGGNVIAQRRFYGYEAVDGGEPDAPAEGDVIVQVGDQIRWKSHGNVIKLATSTEDKATDKTTANAPSITMYYGVGAPRKVGTAVTPYVWQEVTCILSPGKVRINADMFELFSGSTGNVIEPYVVSYELVPTSRTLVKHDDGTTTPNGFGVDVIKRVGSSKTVLKADEYTVNAEVTYEDGNTETFSLADLYESVLRNLTALKLVACSAKDATDVLAETDIAVLSDGKKGADGEPGADGAKGADGEAGVDIYWTPNPLVIKTKTDSNGNVSAVLDENRAAQVMFFRDGINWGDDHIVDFFVYETRGCSALAQKQGNGLFVVIEGIASQEITTSEGKTITVPVTTASVTVAAKYWVTQSAFTHIYATLTVNVDVSAVWGGLKMDMHGLTTQYTQISSKYDTLSSDYKNLPLKTPDALTEYTSSIKQTAREISLKVSETAVGRKNLLVDSAFRKRNVLVTDTYNSGIQVLDNVGGVNSYCLEAVNPGEYPWLSWCGDAGGNIKVKKGQTYTLSVWAKRDSKYAYCYYELWYRPTKSTKHNDSNRTAFQSNAFQFAKDNVWELKTVTIKIPEDAPMEYLEVLLVCTTTSDKNNDDKIHCWYCQPMLVEGDQYVGWSMSKEDAEYVGGNLLDNTDTLKTGGTLTVATENTGLHPTNGSADEIARQTYNGCATLNSDARYYSGNIDTVKWDLGDTGFIKQGQDYMLSFWAKGNKGYCFCAYLYKGGSQGIYAEVLDHVDGHNQLTSGDGYAMVEFDKDYEWKQYWVHWRVVDGNLPKYVLIRCVQGCDLYVSQPKLEYGATVTEYTTSRSMSSRLLDAGIDINSKQITLTADKTVFRDQSGKETAVFKDGAINANLIKAKQAVIDTLRTESVEAGNLNVTGSSRFGIWAIEHDENLGCDIITANDTTVGNVNISGSMIQYTPAFVRSGNPISGYMRTGAQVTEFGCGDGAGNYTGIWLGKSAYTVARGATNDWGLPTGYAIPGATFGAAQLTAYVYSPFGGETPAVYLYKPQGGIVMETNAAIRGVFVNHVHDTGSDSGAGDSTGLIVTTNNSYSITVTLPENPMAGQQVTVVQKGSGKVFIKSTKVNIRTAGESSATQQRVSNSQGQISLFIYDGSDWNCSYMNSRMYSS